MTSDDRMSFHTPNAARSLSLPVVALAHVAATQCGYHPQLDVELPCGALVSYGKDEHTHTFK